MSNLLMQDTRWGTFETWTMSHYVTATFGHAALNRFIMGFQRQHSSNGFMLSIRFLFYMLHIMHTRIIFCNTTCWWQSYNQENILKMELNLNVIIFKRTCQNIICQTNSYEFGFVIHIDDHRRKRDLMWLQKLKFD